MLQREVDPSATADPNRFAESITLIVDDDPFALKLLGAQLQRLGAGRARICTRALDALTLMEAQVETIDLIFCDLQMPDIDGVEFVRHLARIGYRGGLVLVSGEDGRILQTARRLAQAHAINLLAALAKPVDSSRLHDVLQRHAAQRTVGCRQASQTLTIDDLARGIAAGELVCQYQPKVALASGKLIGVEALVRWQHGAHGLVMPDRFVSLAEEHGLIDALTRRVLALALAQARSWIDDGLSLQVCINVSMDNLCALDFPDLVTELARRAGVPLASLTLEVTESRLMKDPRAPLDILTRLRLRGIGVSIDDFGTGHSSLVQLRDLPCTELKLDRSFVHGAERDEAQGAIVAATLAMARALGIGSVGEGVEDRADLEFLRKHRCDVAQGYLIARPMPGDALRDWLAGWDARLPGFLGRSA